MDFSEFSPGYSYPTKMRGLSAQQIASDMKCGWNLGNSLESEKNETYWGNPKTTKVMIDKIAKRGFTTLRVPVRWDDHYIDSNYTINNEYMNRVETVLNYGLSNNMYVIVNIHHNAIQKMVSSDSSTQNRVKAELKSVWTQIGNRFKNYGDKLIFEIINEPRFNEDWDGNSSFYDTLNNYNEVARSTIRSTGGNNTKRLILLPTYCASSDFKKINGWRSLSDDKMIAVSIHAYKPFNFAFDGGGHSDWNNYDEKELSDLFQSLNSTFLKKGIPVVMGEFGSVNKNNINQRVLHAAKYTNVAHSLGIPCLWWDNNCYGIGSEQFGLFDRKSLEFRYDKIADVIVNTYKGIPYKIENPNPSPNHSHSSHSKPYDILFNGSAKASNWNQAVSVETLKHNGPFDCFDINPNGYFYVEYEGKKNEVELILQSWSGEQKWAKTEPSESGNINGHYFSKFSYENCVRSFGTTEFVDQLDKIYVGAKQSSINVLCLRYYFDKNASNNNNNYVEPPKQPKPTPTPSNSSSNNNFTNNSSYVTIFEGSSSSSNWGQAVSMETAKNKGKFNSSVIKPNGYFYVEYTGQKNEVELILQSWSGGENWAKIDPTQSGDTNGRFFTTFSYENCVRSFNTNDFVNKLDKIYVGAKQVPITAFCLRYYSGTNNNNNNNTNNNSGGSSGSASRVSIFEGSSSSSNWGQAVSMETAKNKGKFDSSVIKPNGYFYVEYTGKKNEVELILQSWSGGENWAKIDPTQSGDTNGKFYSKFSYESCVHAFKTSDFKNKLDKIYVGAKNDSITVYKFCYCSN